MDLLKTVVFVIAVLLLVNLLYYFFGEED